MTTKRKTPRNRNGILVMSPPPPESGRASVWNPSHRLCGEDASPEWQERLSAQIERRASR